MVKRFVLQSHCNPAAPKLKNGDSFDSVLTLFVDGVIKLQIPLNVDSSNNRNDGRVEIVNGSYKVACMETKQLGKCWHITRPDGSDELLSLYPNPRHGGRNVASAIFLHNAPADTDTWGDGSEGCPTYPAQYYGTLTGFFEVGEVADLLKC